MRKTARHISTMSVLAATLGVMAAMPTLATAEESSVLEEGKKIAFDRTKGNCLACHYVEGADLPGNIGPALVAMKARFPDKAKLRAQIWDATEKNSNTMMPPFGRHEILSEEEIDKVVEYMLSL